MIDTSLNLLPNTTAGFRMAAMLVNRGWLGWEDGADQEDIGQTFQHFEMGLGLTLMFGEKELESGQRKHWMSVQIWHIESPEAFKLAVTLYDDCGDLAKVLDSVRDTTALCKDLTPPFLRG